MAEKTEWPAHKIVKRKVADLVPYARNARTHSDEQIDQLCAAITKWGWTNPLLIDEANMIIAGHGRVMAAERLGIARVPCIVTSGWDDAAKRAYILADNQLAINAGWDEELLGAELADLGDLDFDLSLVGFSSAEVDALFAGLNGNDTDGGGGQSRSLSERFGAVPFTVFNAREGWWQDRKAAWLSLGIQSELGRGENALGFSDTVLRAGAAKAYNTTEWVKEKGIGGAAGGFTGTSIFDPVLCELAYRWFCPPGGQVIDPFAGGSVRGIVASKLGRKYFGVDLSARQIEANQEQATDICDKPLPIWEQGDSCGIAKLAKRRRADFIFSCPPYANLEVYSDDAADLSTMDYPNFREAYSEIIAATAGLLKDDRFACFVVGDARGKDGAYYGIPWHTIEAFERAGLRLYNEAVLVTSVGSLPIRVGRQFEVGRKLGKTHQNVLVFVKGDPRAATDAIGDAEFDLGELTDAQFGEPL